MRQPDILTSVVAGDGRELEIMKLFQRHNHPNITPLIQHSYKEQEDRLYALHTTAGVPACRYSWRLSQGRLGYCVPPRRDAVLSHRLIEARRSLSRDRIRFPRMRAPALHLCTSAPLACSPLFSTTRAHAAGLADISAHTSTPTSFPFARSKAQKTSGKGETTRLSRILLLAQRLPVRLSEF